MYAYQAKTAKSFHYSHFRYSLEKSNLSALQESTKSLSSQVTMSDERAARAEADVRLEREWRINLQEKEVKLKEQINNLQMYVRQLGDESKKSEHLKIELEKGRGPTKSRITIWLLIFLFENVSFLSIQHMESAKI